MRSTISELGTTRCGLYAPTERIALLVTGALFIFIDAPSQTRVPYQYLLHSLAPLFQSEVHPV